MTQTIEATYENGVFVPAGKPELAEHERVRLTVESIGAANPTALDVVRQRRQSRLRMDETLAAEIATSGEFDLLDTP